MSPVESNLMWSTYAKRDLGIVIKSTYGRLCESFVTTGHTVFIGEIQYGVKIQRTDNSFIPFITKENILVMKKSYEL